MPKIDNDKAMANPDQSVWSDVMARILIVEDNQLHRDALAMLLERNDFEVIEAADGIVGVEKARTWQPELILLDLRMPRMDGFQTIKVLRSSPKTANIPIFVISAWGHQQSVVDRSLKAGADHFFIKPVDEDLLMEAINRLLIPDALKRKHPQNNNQAVPSSSS